jgi:hypothetical protein
MPDKKVVSQAPPPQPIIVRDDKEVVTLSQAVRQLAFDSDGNWVLGSTEDGHTKIWNLSSPNEAMTNVELPTQAADFYGLNVYGCGRKQLVVTLIDGIAKLWRWGGS